MKKVVNSGIKLSQSLLKVDLTAFPSVEYWEKSVVFYLK